MISVVLCKLCRQRVLRNGKTGSKNHAFCHAKMLQKELNSDIAPITTHIKPANKSGCLNVGGKTRNIAFQLVQQQFCKRSCTFLLPVLLKLKTQTL